MSNETEREIKLDVGEKFLLPNFSGLGFDVDDRGGQDMVATYWDTSDLRLARAHYGVRHRSDKAWTVKGPSTAEGSLLTRSEREFAGPATFPPPAVVALVREIVGEVALQPTVELHTHRDTLLITLAGEQVEVVHDRVEVWSAGQRCGEFCEVEIEVKAGDGTLVEPVAAYLMSAGATLSQSTSKYIHALQLAGRWGPQLA